MRRSGWVRDKSDEFADRMKEENWSRMTPGREAQKGKRIFVTSEGDKLTFYYEHLLWWRLGGGMAV